MIDLAGDVERPMEHAPARHPVPRPARLVLGNRSRLPELDAAEIEVARHQRLDRGIGGSPPFLEVPHVAALVGLDAADGLSHTPEKCGVEPGIEVGAAAPRPLEETPP